MSALAGRRLYIVAYCTVAAALVWLIISTAAAGQLADRNPELALRWRPGDPQALTQLAQNALNARNLPRARDYARDAVAHSPHEATAWRLLGEIALASSDAPLAGQLFAQAGTLTHRDAALAAHFFEDAIRAHRYADAVRYADVVMRRAPEKQSALIFRLAALVQDPDAAAALAQTLADKPDWGNAFFRELAGSGVGDDGIVQMLGLLSARHVAMTSAQLTPLLSRLVKDGRAPDAYRVWLATLPPSARPAGLVYDPAFAGPPAAAPFGWTLDDGRNGRARLASPGEQPGLRVVLKGRGSDRIALQTLLLAPGRYRFETSARLVEGDTGVLSWLVGCPGAQAPLDLDLMGSAPMSAAAEFAVDASCPTQVLLLRAHPGDLAAPATALVQRVSVQRIG